CRTSPLSLSLSLVFSEKQTIFFFILTNQNKLPRTKTHLLYTPTMSKCRRRPPTLSFQLRRRRRSQGILRRCSRGQPSLLPDLSPLGPVTPPLLPMAPSLPSPPSPSHPLFATAASCSSLSYRRRRLPTKLSIRSLSLRRRTVDRRHRSIPLAPFSLSFVAVVASLEHKRRLVDD
ncbi:hypothetical protein LINPERHAP2_LOCUS7549, partial [Linum perenne]